MVTFVMKEVYCEVEENQFQVTFSEDIPKSKES